MYIYPFEKLEVWQLARKFRKEIYAMVNQFPREELFGLTSQLKRSASSIGDNISEGSARITSKDRAHFLVIAYSSAVETINHLIGAHDLMYIKEEEYLSLRIKLEEITNKINSLHKAQFGRTS
ncbi:four helix bundle protein [Pedobacter sp. CFBP9032]|uniref:four helix bundle protein n=1 Tax=Pedobacter sp. CFBP9032 TaxID=3096539 RepID=UPI002A69B75F|nr:four helix bundle protein [Pedobacter sp. CFBP9032]MDY0907439.1 four helix bundle protein [Pedobacter sp. CFBP9032]